MLEPVTPETFNAAVLLGIAIGFLLAWLVEEWRNR